MKVLRIACLIAAAALLVSGCGRKEEPRVIVDREHAQRVIDRRSRREPARNLHGLRIDSVRLELWMGKEIPRLADFVPEDDTPVLTPERDGKLGIGFRMAMEMEGVINLKDGEWVYVKAYSSHGSGNLVLAADSEGHLHASNGHVCPDLQLQWLPQRAPEELTLQNFFTSEVYGGDAYGWQLVDDWKTGPHRKVEFNNADDLIKAALTIRKGDSLDAVYQTLGLDDSGGSRPKEHFVGWKKDAVELCVVFSYENVVTGAYYDSLLQRTYLIGPARTDNGCQLPVDR